MLAEHENISVLTEHRLHSARVSEKQIESITLKHADDAEVLLAAHFFVDATYEGDLMAAAKVPFHVGREGREKYGESLAPESGDDQLQGYNFRLTMTDTEANRAPVPKPDGYVREDYLELLPLLRDESVKRIFGDPYQGLRGGIYKRQTPTLPNGKRDINDVSHSIVRLSLPNINGEWPKADVQTRHRIFSEHLRHNVGMLISCRTILRCHASFRLRRGSGGFVRTSSSTTSICRSSSMSEKLGV